MDFGNRQASNEARFQTILNLHLLHLLTFPPQIELKMWTKKRKKEMMIKQTLIK